MCALSRRDKTNCVDILWALLFYATTFLSHSPALLEGFGPR